MQMHMVVSVDMIERETGLEELLQLRANFRLQLLSCRRTEEEIDTRAHEAGRESPVRLNEVGDAFRRENGSATDDNHVQAYPERGQAVRALDRIGRRRRAYHQARRGKDSLPMRMFDRLIDRDAETEVVARHDELLQA